MPDNARPISATSAAYAALRVVSGLLFLQFGGKIVLGWFPEGAGAADPAVALTSQIGIGGLLELIGGLLVLLGLLTRPAAFVLSGEMAVAYWQFHAPHGFWPVQNDGTPSVLFCFIFLLFAVQGAGAWSLDSWIRQRRGASSSPPGQHDQNRP